VTSYIRNPGQFWAGVAFVGFGVVGIYFGVDLTNTNLKTFVDPVLIGGALLIIGSVSLTVGLVAMLLGWLSAKR
jgi:uncharacterized membrane protein AbrB (regulator of aidB expression)